MLISPRKAAACSGVEPAYSSGFGLRPWSTVRTCRGGSCSEIIVLRDVAEQGDVSGCACWFSIRTCRKESRI